jgi:hypothetical protein
MRAKIEISLACLILRHLQENTSLTPIIMSSHGKLVSAVYDQGGKRAIIDGGFTRLFNKW